MTSDQPRAEVISEIDRAPAHPFVVGPDAPAETFLAYYLLQSEKLP